LKEEALDRTVWRARFGRGFGPVVRQTNKWMNVWAWNLVSHLKNVHKAEKINRLLKDNKGNWR
jgi:hypothetical protein